MDKLRTGIIGCGHIAKRHATHLSALPDIDLIGFCDQIVENAQNFCRQYGHTQSRVYSDFAKMFAELDLDLVYICLPPFAHSNEVELACRHRVNLLIEKPIALTMELARLMAQQVDDSGVKSQVGFMYRFGEAALALKRQMQNQCGFMSVRYGCNSLHSAWWRDRSKSGGQLVEQVIHLFDLTRYYFGEATQVFSMQGNLFHRDVPDYSIEDASGTVIRFASGAIATLAATNGAIPGRWDCDWRIYQPGLTVDFADPNHAVFHHTDQTPPTSTSVSGEQDLYLAETLHLIAAIRDNRQTFVPIEEGVRSLHLALAAMRSAEDNVPVTIELPT